MKKLLGLFIGLVISISATAQSVEFTDAGESYNKKETLSFNFHFDNTYAAQDLTETGTYYTNYFTTEVMENEDKSHNVKITLTEESEMGRRVIMRYFVSLEVGKIKAGVTEYSTEDFMIQFIQL
ncbi:MAG: hypothetical protein MK078_11160 [Crocinitomicaceae bacterium]|nr:hypothetical protein [Crocinitomicaceae bacterium]